MAVEIKRTHKYSSFKYRGKTLDELLEMPIIEFAKLCSAKSRRRLVRGITKEEYQLIKAVLKYHSDNNDSENKPLPIKTKERSMVIIPCMINTSIAVHRGNGYFEVEIKPEMLGKKLKDFVPTRSHPSHARKGVSVVTNDKIKVIK